MFERLTTMLEAAEAGAVPAQLAVVDAQEQACRRGSDRICTEHLLLGLFAVPGNPAVRVLERFGVGLDTVERALDHRRGGVPVSNADALASLGIDLELVQQRVDEAFGSGALDRSSEARSLRLGRHLPFDRGTKKALKWALREALRMKHDLDLEHFLLGLLHVDGVARTVLTAHGVRLDTARAVVEEMAERWGAR